ncbi:MAG: hypothetical protein KKE20_03570 [Nanoarchaeota archaeon]|nr:hypothetical protein [Nanoarchaeota archaeon]
MKELTPEEERSFKELEENFNNKVEEYGRNKNKELSEGRKDELEKELKDIESYLEIYYKGEVDDIITNIRFIEAKHNVLKELLR